MATDVMLNVRLDKGLKEHGCQVLEKNGLSVTSLVRNLFEYMEATQQVPEQIVAVELSKAQVRRKAVRAAVGVCQLEPDFDYEQARQDYRLHRAAKCEAGVRS